ncbi:MAG: hypothetical protein ACTSQS_07475 [Promethearchaeota archaeon]
MRDLKIYFTKIKNSDKFKALKKELTPTELILIFIPFLISLVSSKFVTRNLFSFTFLGLSLMICSIILYLAGIKKRVIYFAILLSIACIIMFVVGNPFVYWTKSDRDEEIRNCIEAIFRGENPYYTMSSLGLRPSNLPFSYFLYMPIYLITNGHTFFMALITIVFFYIFIFYKFIDSENDKIILPIISFITFSDFFFLEMVMQSDLLTIQILFCLCLFILPDKIPEQKILFKYIKLTPHEPLPINKKVLSFSILFGSLLAARMHLWLIGVIVFLYILKIYGFKNTIILSIISISCFLAWILPFMLMDIDWFINVAPIGHNCKMSNWRDDELIFPGNIIVTILKSTLNYGMTNCIIITIFIIFITIILGLIQCKNKFHLFLIIASAFLFFLFFYLFISTYNVLIRDYVSLAGIPLIIAFLFSKLEFKEEM